MKELGEERYDVFLAHNSQDKPAVRLVAAGLQGRGVSVWLDVEQIPPGRWFQDVIQGAILKVKAVAILLGPCGLGKWQKLELRAFISQCVDKDIPAIPVLLPGVETVPDDLVFLRELSWVKFRQSPDEERALTELEWGITGRKPAKSSDGDV